MTAAVTLLFAAWVGLVCAGLFAYLHHAATRRARWHLSAAAQDVATDLREVSASTPLRRITATLEGELQESVSNSGVAHLVVDAHGRVVWHSLPPLPPWPHPGQGWRVATVPAGAYTVVLALHWQPIREELRERLVALLLLGGLAVAAAALGSWILVGRTLAPIGLLSRHAREASVESLQVRLCAPSPDAEIIELVGTLNGLLARLAETAAVRGRFYAAASHELRTPLQALSGHLEVALNRERTGAEYRAAIGEALAQTRRLTRLAQDLLLLNQLDSATSAEAGEPVDLAEVAARAVQQVRPLIAERGLQVATDALSETVVVGPPAHLEMLVRNLVDNAVRYTDPAGEVRLATEARPEEVTLTVFNQASSLADDDPTALLEAFSRTHRPRHSRSGGSGLGLAISSALARANGWRLTLHREAGGVVATLVLRTERAGESGKAGLPRGAEGGDT